MSDPDRVELLRSLAELKIDGRQFAVRANDRSVVVDPEMLRCVESLELVARSCLRKTSAISPRSSFGHLVPLLRSWAKSDDAERSDTLPRGTLAECAPEAQLLLARRRK